MNTLNMQNDKLPIKSNQPEVDEVLAAITSFNDANVVMAVFQQLGWNCTEEIKETLSVARQNTNLGVSKQSF